MLLSVVSRILGVLLMLFSVLVLFLPHGLASLTIKRILGVVGLVLETPVFPLVLPGHLTHTALNHLIQGSRGDLRVRIGQRGPHGCKAYGKSTALGQSLGVHDHERCVCPGGEA